MRRDYSHWGGEFKSLIPLAFRQGVYGGEQSHYFPYAGLSIYGPLKTIDRIKIVHIMTKNIVSYLNKDNKFHELLATELESRLKKILRVPMVKIEYEVSTSYDEKFFKDFAENIREEERAIILVALPKKYMGHYQAKKYYHLIKAWCLSKGVIVQAYSDNIIRALTSKKIGGREIILRNLTLNIFAKAGGIPWGLREDELIPYDIVLGLSWSFYRGTGRTGPITKVFSQVHTFSEKGTWQSFYGKIAESRHLEKLIASSLKEALSELKYTKPKDYYRVLVLSMKRLSSNEIRNIISSCDSLRKEGIIEADIDIIISQITLSGGVRIYCKISPGIPKRGIYFYLNASTIVYLPIGLIGDRETEWSKGFKVMGTPVPLKIRLLYPNEKEVLKNMRRVREVCEACHKLAIMNWRTIRGLTRLPTPLHYSKLISDFVKELKGIIQLDNVFIIREGVIFETREKLKERPWFI